MVHQNFVSKTKITINFYTPCVFHIDRHQYENLEWERNNNPNVTQVSHVTKVSQIKAKYQKNTKQTNNLSFDYLKFDILTVPPDRFQQINYETTH